VLEPEPAKPVASKPAFFAPGKDSTPAVAEVKPVPTANPLPEMKRSVMSVAESREKVAASKPAESAPQATTKANWWSTKGTPEAKPEPAKVKAEVAVASAAQVKPMPSPKVESAAPATTPAYVPGQPLGVQSVIAAGAYDPQTPVSVPTPVLSIPQRHPVTPAQPQAAMRPANEYEVNAFTPPGMMGTPATPATPQAQAVANAFTQPQAPALLPPQVNTPVTQAVYGAPEQSGAKSKPTVSDAERVKQIITGLHEALLPSEREYAADALSNLDWQEHPDAVLALTQAAKDDPAVTVRTSCIRGLAKMKVRTAAVLTALERLRTDGNECVRQEAEEALASMGK
jgi:hypothetical protein